MYIVFGFKNRDFAGLPFTRLRTADHIIIYCFYTNIYIYNYVYISRNTTKHAGLQCTRTATARRNHLRPAGPESARRTTAVCGRTVIVGVSTTAAVETSYTFIYFSSS